MSRSITFYYGMCGTFKATTIEAKKEKDDLVIWSDIKPWKKLENLLEIRQNDKVYAALHLYHLRKDIEEKLPYQNIYVERGVTDMMYYYYKNNPSLDIDVSLMNELVNTEIDLCNDLFEIKKVLLIQEDEDFIKNVIFKEPTRLKEFSGGVQEYLQKQESYILFTKEYNDIDSVIVINNAKEYLEDVLGVTYNL